MTRTINVDYLARVEGEGALTIHLDGERATEVKLRIFEPPRFFEGFLRGRSLMEVPDITARICGICPVAYQMSACRALEDALQVDVDPRIGRLRRLLYCGEWIESHCLHMFLLHAPDFLGFEDAISMAGEHGELVQRGLRMKKAGNAIVNLLGGREIHPINVRVGGFYRLPERAELDALLPELEWARDAALQTVADFAQFTMPDFHREYEFVALRHATDYPFCEGRLVSSQGLDIDVRDYHDYFEEEHQPHSTALHSSIRGRGDYFCGPLARVNLNFDRLSEPARQAAEQAGLVPVCNNPFMSLVARAVEVVQAFDEAVRQVEAADLPPTPYTPFENREATGFGCTEAPRGILYHRYRVNAQGLIEDAVIIPPTSQNQKCIEADLFAIAPQLASIPHAEATWLAEQTVRNYDPCISCSTHFLQLKIEQQPCTR